LPFSRSIWPATITVQALSWLACKKEHREASARNGIAGATDPRTTGFA
jgi:hypothetical protein